MDSVPDRNLGKYQLLGRIGHGGMAEVWLAHQQGPMGFEKMVAIKRLLPHMESEQQFVRMFLDEARIAARINHANVVQIFDLGQQHGFYIAMEYLAGESMSRVMGEGISREDPLTVQLAALVMSQMCKGLHHAHALTDNDGVGMNIIHRDVSPQNIMILYDGGVKLLDFGIAKARERLSETTVTGLKGKYAYMSPEQVTGSPMDHRSDIFSAGTVFWESLTRRRLFKHANKLIMMKMITEGRVPPPSKFNPSVDEELDDIALRALSRSRDRRFGSALEMSTAIDEYLVTAGIPSNVSQIAAYMDRVFSREKQERTEWIREATRSDSVIDSGRMTDYWLDMIPDATDTVVSFSRSSIGTSVGKPLPPRSSRWWIATAVIATLAALTATVLLLLSQSSSSQARLRVQSSPPGATVEVDGERRLASTPGVIAALDPGRRRVVLRLKGYPPWERMIRLDPGETLRIEAALERSPRGGDSGPAAAQARPASSASADTGAAPDTFVVRAGPDAGSSASPPRDAGSMASPARDARSMAPIKPAPPVRPIRPPGARRPRETGQLNLATIPWTTIYHRRRKLGNTPLIRVKLPVGKVRLRAVNRQAGINTIIEVQISKGKLVRRRVTIGK